MSEPGTDPSSSDRSSSDRTWFDGARFGMFVHWDHASQRGWEVSWPLVGGVFSLPKSQQTTAAEYHALAATFDPTEYDPVGLAQTAAAAGMRYVVFTARHHNGYSMYDTAVSDHKVSNSPYGAPSGRDLVRETADAFRSEGLHVGLYYSLSDWYHPDYPAWTEDFRPYRLGFSPPLPTDEQANRFRGYMMAQLRELLTGYGRIDIVWFDGGWERPATWWDTGAIESLIHDLQPDALINDRLPGRGDFVTPEQFVPATAPAARWESCLTMNDSWGYNPDDTEYKSARAIIHALCETAGRGGNLLLNVSPKGDGTIPDEQTVRLAEVAGWMSRHASAIHDTTAGLEPWQFYGPSTRTGQAGSSVLVNLFLLMRPYETVTVRGLPVRRIQSVRVLASGTELRFDTRTGIFESLMPDPDGEIIITVPATEIDEYATVLQVEIAPAP